MVDDFNLVLGDFGLSIDLNEEIDQLFLKGTEYYLDPVFLENDDFFKYDEYIDVYSLGVTFTHLLHPYVVYNKYKERTCFKYDSEYELCRLFEDLITHMIKSREKGRFDIK